MRDNINLSMSTTVTAQRSLSLALSLCVTFVIHAIIICDVTRFCSDFFGCSAEKKARTGGLFIFSPFFPSSSVALLLIYDNQYHLINLIVCDYLKNSSNRSI